MPTDERRRDDFIVYLKQLKQTWFIAKETETAIIQSILAHKDSKLTAYIGYFKHLVWQMENNVRVYNDTYTENPPADGKYVNSFVGAGVTTNNYTSNYALRLFFSKINHEIYKFEVLC